MRVAILDDYQRVALSSADWSPLAGLATVEVVPPLAGLITGEAAPSIFVSGGSGGLPPAEAAQPPAGLEELARALADYDVIVAMRERTRFPAQLLERLPRLRLLVTTGAVNAAIDLAACARQGVTVCGTGSVAGVTAEYAWALLMTAAKRLDLELPATRRGAWQVGRGGELPVVLRGRVLGVVGLGRVGSEVAGYGRAFGMTVLGHDPHLPPDRFIDLGVTAVTLDRLLAESDFVTLHLALTPATVGLIGAARLAAMKPTAWLINTSRGPIVDRTALLEACRHGRIAGAALDVYDQEPLPASDELRRRPNIIASPHLGYVAQEQWRRWYGDVVEDIVAFAAGAPIRRLA
ncbi:MAG: D-2-hydroxyacid dehydrogenase family protein [Propionibacteriaceae bacterium]|jgi:phosphoglycerate dehydrogenase-like enzyme|nr:D-2-hydroxyacid dehydrogenase family protein [Propionibacteriaceae bacterium]